MGSFAEWDMKCDPMDKVKSKPGKPRDEVQQALWRSQEHQFTGIDGLG